jgi:hypothetical protein
MNTMSTMSVLSESRERFLLAIAAQVPPERIAEIHFFQPIKQGGVESGVAVVAAWPERAPVSSDEEAQPVDAPPPVANDAAGSRHTIYTARYRLTLKGPDRGKWESSVVAEADAPLVTVDAVVRGVQRRSGDVDDTTRMDGDEARTLLEAKRAAS